MPKYRFKSVLHITAEDFRKMGVSAVSLDLDNTICLDGTMEFIEGLDGWLHTIQSAGIKITIVTNELYPRAKRVSKALGIPFISFAKKPLTRKLRLAAKRMGVSTSEMAIVGDQLFSDMKAANKCGAVAVLVDRMEGKTYYKKYYEMKRRKEAPVIAEFEKKYGYGVYDE